MWIIETLLKHIIKETTRRHTPTNRILFLNAVRTSDLKSLYNDTYSAVEDNISVTA